MSKRATKQKLDAAMIALAKSETALSAAAKRFGRAGHRARRDRAAFLSSLRAAIALGVVHE